MKPLPLLLLICLLTGVACWAQHKPAGTTFLLREHKNGTYHAVYIDRNRAAVYYKYIAAFRFDQLDMESYRSSVAMLKAGSTKLFKKHKLLGLPRRWCRLYPYKDQYYVYSPSDYMGNYRVAVSDTTYIDYWGDGPTASRIDNLQKINAKTYRLELTAAGGGREVRLIHIIDPQKVIAVFEDPDAAPRDRYMLMVNAAEIRHFAVIVNYCDRSKQLEYNFESPDFRALLHR